MNRTIIIGDIHGCFDELLELWQKLKISQPQDRVILLGDLVHKGKFSAEVVNFVIDNKIETIMGNHDDFFLKALQGLVKPYKEYNEILPKIKMGKEKLILWFQKLPLWIESDHWIAIHGGLDPEGLALKNQNREILMNLRYWDSNNQQPVFSSGHEEVKPDWLPWYDCLKKEIIQNKKIFYGHWAKKEVQFDRDDRIIGLDTGCCYGGKLSAYVVEENRLVQVNSKQKKQFNY